MKTSQKKLIKKVLLDKGEVTRNWALQNRITRLSAIILNLKNEGLKIDGFDRDNDYVYQLTSKPYKPQIIIKEINGERVAVYG